MRDALSSAIALVVCLLPLAARADDWPQYRCDSGRTGFSAERLPDSLSLQWSYHAPHAPRPAWPDVYWQRQTYDLAYQPVVSGGTLYYGSSADGKVHALDAGTGRQRWSFFTDAPVRFAPAVWKGRVLVASDDGCLYALAAGDGKLLWKRRGGPEDRKILGNGRMVSRWPARGGPVVHDNVVYFGAGIFPSQGFFLHALDPETGKGSGDGQNSLGEQYRRQPQAEPYHRRLLVRERHRAGVSRGQRR
jgi:outer membrane protein assembly factor BamB